jgi:predicted ATP-dependent Lon-type protease
MVVLGSMSLGGNVIPVENLAESLQVAFDAGAKRILLPMASVTDIPTIPGELFAKFQCSVNPPSAGALSLDDVFMAICCQGLKANNLAPP